MKIEILILEDKVKEWKHTKIILAPISHPKLKRETKIKR